MVYLANVLSLGSHTGDGRYGDVCRYSFCEVRCPQDADYLVWQPVKELDVLRGWRFLGLQPCREYGTERRREIESAPRSLYEGELPGATRRRPRIMAGATGSGHHRVCPAAKRPHAAVSSASTLAAATASASSKMAPPVPRLQPGVGEDIPGQQVLCGLVFMRYVYGDRSHSPT